MDRSRPHASSPHCALSPQNADLRSDSISPMEFDLEEMPDEIDLLVVLWGHIRSYHLQLHPVSLPGH